jgi:hypothetical protein
VKASLIDRQKFEGKIRRNVSANDVGAEIITKEERPFMKHKFVKL